MTKLPPTPTYTGKALLDLVELLESDKSVAAEHAAQTSFQKLRYMDIRGFPTTLPLPMKMIVEGNKHAHAQKNVSMDVSKRSPSYGYYSFWDYHMSYSKRETTPTDVAQHLIQAVEASAQHEWLRPIVKEDILRQAAASTERYNQGKPLSAMDGVFMAFKEDEAIKGYIATSGSTFLNKDNPSLDDATPIARLRAAGVIVVGQTRMQEFGWDTFGINPNSGTPRNPYKLTSSCGGSSSGCGGIIAGGVVPSALGGDGGGSIRIPSSFCGVYGLKPTVGRVSGYGSMGVCPSVGVTGPLGITADDMTMVLSIISGPDAKDEKTLLQPPLDLTIYNQTESLADLTIGIMPNWNKECLEPAIVVQLEKVLAHLKTLGAKVVEIEIKNTELARHAQMITISSEMNSFIRRFPDNHNDLLASNRAMMALLDQSTPTDYVKAQQIRTIVIKEMEDIFKEVDVIMTPTTAILAFDFPEDCFDIGMLSGGRTGNCTQFTGLANFTGIPAVAVPAGFDNEKPVSVQFFAPWYEEAQLCRLAKVCESAPGIERRCAPHSYHGNFLPKNATL
ncbi:amidase signature enzyme [Hesseltinella vesiculosa]|uniref:Amidase signature enzyme n=1 Tax=Hesseltinella vesiculosa TaxID=101127 RepID=A0A1X2GWH0_9FUNG|nr:amidase signature enzyme [Hesseltinella vesiculosa]